MKLTEISFFANILIYIDTLDIYYLLTKLLQSKSAGKDENAVLIANQAFAKQKCR